MDHMRVVGQHVLDLLRTRPADVEQQDTVLLSALQIKTSELLTESALYMSMALSRFPEARTVLEVAMQIQKMSNCPSAQLSASMARTEASVFTPALAASSSVCISVSTWASAGSRTQSWACSKHICALG